MIKFKHKGSFKNTDRFLKKVRHLDLKKILSALGAEGVRALASMTPVDTGETASSWDFEVTISGGSSSIHWTNSHMAGGTPVAILLQYGHGTGTGGYVEGLDYINPAIQPIFDRIAEQAWKAVTSA